MRKDIDYSVNFSTSVVLLPDELKEYIRKKYEFTNIPKDYENTSNIETKYSIKTPETENDYANMTINEKITLIENYIQITEYEKAINMINSIIHSNKKQYDNSTLVSCYKLKCNIYNALKGNSNSLFAIICNEAVRKTLQK